MKVLSYFVFILSLGIITSAQTSNNLNPEDQPTSLTAHEDHQRMMKLLKIDSLRPGPSGNPADPNYANTDESKANPYPCLPDPLIMKNADPVKTQEDWWNVRRKEIVEDFDREVYGRMPVKTPNVNWEIVSTKNIQIKGIPAVSKELKGRVDNSNYPHIEVNLKATLVIPREINESVPVIIHFGFDFSKFPNFDTTKLPPDFNNWKAQLLTEGWGYAVLIPTEYQDDNGGGLTKGIIGLCNKGKPRQLDDWGALRAWAWGASRLLDYFENDQDVDEKRVGIEGLSRYGKAALVTMAYDERFAIGFIGSSGAAGAKLHRRLFGEQVENIASEYEYHWMAGNYIKYAGPFTPDDLPVDSHELIALCAPRPVFIGVGDPKVEGYWIDAKGMFLAAVNAGPVYRLLGSKDLGATEMPPIGTELIDGEIAFRQHFGGHTNTPNWSTFIKFAGKYFSD